MEEVPGQQSEYQQSHSDLGRLQRKAHTASQKCMRMKLIGSGKHKMTVQHTYHIAVFLPVCLTLVSQR